MKWVSEGRTKFWRTLNPRFWDFIEMQKITHGIDYKTWKLLNSSPFSNGAGSRDSNILVRILALPLPNYNVGSELQVPTHTRYQ
jgi:hypothetical protein